MNKLLLFIIIIETIALGFVLTKDINLPTGFVVKEVLENYTPDSIDNNASEQVFSTYTKAVCNSKKDFTICSDRIFVKCGEIEHILPDLLNNSIVVDNNWQDPRKLGNKTI
ncbi:hypothetical protein CMO89_02945 [Candidatus Woesearchaeota archaeon]|nr:hypothetical protein [Candidatus Woesearchaeota archaeon]